MANALQVNGSPDKIGFGNILLSQTVVTAGFWLYPTATSSGNQETIFGYGNTRWFFIYGANTTKLRFSIKSGGVEKSTGNTTNNLTLNAWNYVIATYDPNAGTNNITIRIYDNSSTLIESKSATVTGGIDSTSQPIEFGHDPARGFYIRGIVQLIQVWDRILTVTEQNNLALFINPDTPVAKWDINEGSGTVVHDTSTNNNNGTITGSTWVTSGIGTTTSTSTSTSSSTSTSTTTTSTSTTTTTSTSSSTSSSTTTTMYYEFKIDHGDRKWL